MEFWKNPILLFLLNFIYFTNKSRGAPNPLLWLLNLFFVKCCQGILDWMSKWRFLPTAREGNVFRSVCHSVHREGYGVTFCLIPCSFQDGGSASSGGVGNPSGTDIYWRSLQQSVRILLECILVILLCLHYSENQRILIETVNSENAKFGECQALTDVTDIVSTIEKSMCGIEKLVAIMFDEIIICAWIS